MQVGDIVKVKNTTTIMPGSTGVIVRVNTYTVDVEIDGAPFPILYKKNDVSVVKDD